MNDMRVEQQASQKKKTRPSRAHTCNDFFCRVRFCISTAVWLDTLAFLLLWLVHPCQLNMCALLDFAKKGACVSLTTKTLREFVTHAAMATASAATPSAMVAQIKRVAPETPYAFHRSTCCGDATWWMHSRGFLPMPAM